MHERLFVGSASISFLPGCQYSMRDALQRRLVSLVCIRVISCSILQHLLPQSRHCRSNSSQAARFTQPPPTEAANDSQELVEMMQNLLQANTVSQRLGQGKGKMKIIKMLVSDSEDDCVDEEQIVVKRIRSERPSAPENTLSNLETPSINKQEEHYSPNVPYSESSSSEEDDPMFHLSKLELCAKIRGLKRKLRYTTRENSRLRQSLALLQVLPQAVTHFEELVGMADALLKSRVNPTSSSTVPHPTWNTSGNPLTESCTAIQSNGISQVTLPVVKEEPSTVKQFQIENWQISLCNKSKPQKFINDLMQALYTHEYMATHSLTGAKSSSSKDRAAKPAMNQNEVQEIIGVTKQLFTNMDDALIRRMMGQKLNNCTKKQNASKDHTSTVFDNYVF